MPSAKKTVLVCAAHPDDEVLGCGGTIARHAREGWDVHIAIMAQGLASRGETASEPSQLETLRAAGRRAAAVLGARSIEFHDFPDNRMDEVARLDVAKALEAVLRRLEPRIVYTHHPIDLNVDHVRVNECVAVACRPQPGSSVRDLRFFEIPSSTEWRAGAGAFAPNLFVDIGGFLSAKIEALREYDSEMRPWPHSRSYEAVEHLAKWRGATAGLPAAEAFVIGRQIEPVGGAE
ncbi:MAG: PIG-L family deacetylase [Vulcanimicrobiaceae bacterium]